MSDRSAPITIGFVGMTHLGLVSAVVTAAKGFDVVCFDENARRIRALKEGRLHIFEPGLAELLLEADPRISWTTDPAKLGEARLLFLAEDVPTDDAGDSDLGPIDGLFQIVVDHAARDAVVVVMSQVPPGYTRSRSWPPDQLIYQVETLVLGVAVERASNPERLIVGRSRTDLPMPGAYRSFLDQFECPVLDMSYESAEFTKIAINCMLAASVTTTNTLAELCEKLGADWGEIAPALRLDRRIGPHAYLTPGLGIGGGNIERDLQTVARLAAAHETDAGIIDAITGNSSHRRDWAARTITAQVTERLDNPLVAVLGLAYKADSASIKNSPALALLRSLTGVRVRVFDPVVSQIDESIPGMEYATDVMGCCDGADAVAIMTPWNQFEVIDPKELSRVLTGDVVVDPFRVLDSQVCAEAGLRYFTLGAGA